jgi:hypothetical protein
MIFHKLSLFKVLFKGITCTVTNADGGPPVKVARTPSKELASILFDIATPSPSTAAAGILAGMGSKATHDKMESTITPSPHAAAAGVSEGRSTVVDGMTGTTASSGMTPAEGKSGSGQGSAGLPPVGLYPGGGITSCSRGKRADYADQ